MTQCVVGTVTRVLLLSQQLLNNTTLKLGVRRNSSIHCNLLKRFDRLHISAKRGRTRLEEELGRILLQDGFVVGEDFEGFNTVIGAHARVTYSSKEK